MTKLNNLKGQRGFTLVEVIVVAIIVAALAGVAIPMYTSYVTSSRENAAANTAGSIASYMGSCINQAGTVASSTITAGTETNGLAAGTLTCTAGNTKMEVPKNFKINISSFTTSGSVEATHVGGGAKQTYNY